MTLPSSYSTHPDESPHHYFRNVCIAFKKKIATSKNISELQEEMLNFINASKQMNWHHLNGQIWKKDEGEKAVNKVWDEFKRYIHDLEKNSQNALSQDLIEAISEVERLIHTMKVD